MGLDLNNPPPDKGEALPDLNEQPPEDEEGEALLDLNKQRPEDEADLLQIHDAHQDVLLGPEITGGQNQIISPGTYLSLI